MDTHLRVLSKSYPMNTNMTGFGWFSKNLCIVVLGEWFAYNSNKKPMNLKSLEKLQDLSGNLMAIFECILNDY